jgi:hypothetical protein
MNDSYAKGRKDNPRNVFRAEVGVEKILYADDQVERVKSKGNM